MKLLRILFRLFAIYVVAVLILGIVYSVIPPISTLMVGRWLTFHGTMSDSVSLDDVDRTLLRAVLRAEDSRFCEHSGVDWKSLNDAIEEAVEEDGPSRGASTISMQVAKNLFLWPGRSYIRKALEIPIALYLDLIWSKSRMMEVYLSVAEWGDGVYGVEAASQKYFHHSAQHLTAWESALLAAALPNPRKRHPDRPSGYYNRYAQSILIRIQAGANTSCLK